MFRNFMNSVFTGAKLHLMVTLHQMYEITYIQRRYLCFQPNLLQLYVQSYNQHTYLSPREIFVTANSLTQLYNFQANSYLLAILT